MSDLQNIERLPWYVGVDPFARTMQRLMNTINQSINVLIA
jgi:hypothetical protein